MPAAISLVHLRQAARIIHDGGVVAYPTEGVFGLGCDPWQHSAVLRILAIKERAVAAGLILIATDRRQLDGWIDPSAAEERALAATDPFVTWVVTAEPDCPEWITGGRSTCAVRITQHPVAAALCRENRTRTGLNERQSARSGGRQNGSGGPVQAGPMHRFHPAWQGGHCARTLGNSLCQDRGRAQSRVNKAIR